MTMASLISRRVAESARNRSRQVDAASALEEWEAEGGASAGMPPTGEHGASRPSPCERLLLERLGAALVGEWSKLPAPLQRTLYDHAAGGTSSSNRLTMRRRMARFLHDHKVPRTA